MVFAFAAKLVMSYDETKAKKNNLRGSFKDFLDGLISFPINIPGTAFHACLQVRIYSTTNNYIDHLQKKRNEKHTMVSSMND